MTRLSLLATVILSFLAVAAYAQFRPGGGPYSTLPSFPTTAPATAPASEFPGKLVTVRANAIPLREAFDQLGQQSGLQFSLSTADLEQKTVTLEARERPLWETVQALLKQVNPSPSPDLRWAVRYIGAPTGRGVTGPLSTKGPFMVNLQRITRHVSTTPDQLPRIILSASAVSDASLALSGVATESTPTRVTDDAGRSLVFSGPLAHTMTPCDATNIVPRLISIVLQYPADGPRPQKIALLEGTIPATYVLTDPVELTPGQKITKRYDQLSATCELTVAKTTTIRITYKPDESMTDAQWTDWQQQANAVRMSLLDADDKGLPTDGRQTGTSNRPRSYSISESFPPRQISGLKPQPIPTGTPTKAVIHAPVSFKAIEIPYHFEDLTVP